MKRTLTKLTGKGRTATAMGNYSVFVLLSLLHSFAPPTPHCQASHAYSLCCSSPTLIRLHFYCFSSLLGAFPFCPPPAPPHRLSCPVSLILFTPCCPACSQPCRSPTHIAYLTCFYPPLHMQTHCCLSSVHLFPYTNTHKDRPVQTSAYWRWSHFQ